MKYAWLQNYLDSVCDNAPQRKQLLTWLSLALVSHLYFIDQPSWNQLSRLALTRAIVEHGSFQIDDYHDPTGDKSWREGHFYCDKAPGVSFLAVPGYAIFAGLRLATGRELPTYQVEPLDPLDKASGNLPAPADMLPGDKLILSSSTRAALWAAKASAILPGLAFGLAALFWLARRLGASFSLAALVTATYGFATPAFAYATAFYGHRPTADGLLVAFALICSRPFTTTKARLVGICLGLAVLCEYPSAVPAIFLTLWVALRHGWRPLLQMVLCAAPFALLLAFYHWVAFGSPLSTGYDWVYLPEFADGMRVQYGIRAPDLNVLAELTFGSYRGIFTLCPVMLLATWGFLRSYPRFTSASMPNALGASAYASALAIIVFELCLSAGYYMWDGGAAFGPRHLLPALPFLSLGLVFSYRHAPRLTIALATISACIAWLATVARPEAPQTGHPVWDYAVSMALARGIDEAPSTLGHLVGLPGLWSLVPLLALWALAWPPPAKADLQSNDCESPPHSPTS